MTIEEMLDETGIIYAEGCFKGEVEPPYIAYLTSRCDQVSADGKVIYSRSYIAVELYHTRRDRESEKKLESVLRSHNINYSKSVAWIGNDQMLYEKTYIFEEKECY